MNAIMTVCAVILGVMAVALYILLFYAYALAIKRCEDLEDRLMANSLTEYSDKKQRDSIIKKTEKAAVEEELNTDKFEQPLKDDEVE